MPRRARIAIADIPWHIVQRGNNRSACFYAEEDYVRFLETLRRMAEKFECSIHAYALMTNHVHLLLTPIQKDAPGQLMKNLGQRYVQYINRQYGRSGTLWEGRFRSCLTQTDRHLLNCYRYIELNPVRAGMVSHPEDYEWSSYRANASGRFDPVLTPHPEYLMLGRSEPDRISAYRDLFAGHLEPEYINAIRRATQGNFALGDERFCADIAVRLSRRVTPGVGGRPRGPTKPVPEEGGPSRVSN